MVIDRASGGSGTSGGGRARSADSSTSAWVGGTQLRVRFSNELGNGPLTINAAHVAVCIANPVSSTIDTETDRALAFSGNASVTIAQGEAVWSDPLTFALAPLSNLSVTVA